MRAEEHSLVVSVLLIDIDDFKTVNDSLGHGAGDTLLREFAVRLVHCLRPGDVVGRLGGDEFAVIVLTPDNSHAGIDVAGRIRNALRGPFVLDGQTVPVTTSIGIASYPDDAVELKPLIRCADAAMYEAKAAGRNAFRCYTAEMNARALEKSDIDGALRLAQGRDEFVLYYQPKMDIGSGECDKRRSVAAVAAAGARSDPARSLHTRSRGDGSDRTGRRVGDRHGMPADSANGNVPASAGSALP